MAISLSLVGLPLRTLNISNPEIFKYKDHKYIYEMKFYKGKIIHKNEKKTQIVQDSLHGLNVSEA